MPAPPPGSLRTVPAVLARAASQHADAPAVIIGERGYSYRQLFRRGLAAAAALQEAGVGPGDPVLLMLPNVIEFIDAWIGLAMLGAVEVPVNTGLVGAVLRHQVASSGAQVIVVHASLLERLAGAVPEPERPRAVAVGGPSPGPPAVAWPELLARADLGAPGRPAPPSPAAEHDRLAVMYTSGTTGPAKGVDITHVHAFTYASTVARLLRLSPGDRYFAPLPLFHIAGQWALVYACLQAGATAVVAERFSASRYWDTVREHAVTASFLLGTMANMLARQPERADDGRNPLDRVLMVPLVDDVARFRERFQVQICTCYGSTESNVPVISGYDVTDPRVAGRAAPGYSLRVADEFDYEVPDGAVGELLVRAHDPWVIATSYHTGGSAATFRNCWLHTGDAFRRDSAGNYYFVDRVRDYIRRRGENISSSDIEREVNAFPAVAESAAVGYHCDLGEDEVAVFAVPKPGMALVPGELTSFLAERLPRFMVPGRVEVVPELPKTLTGKIQKHLLRDRLASPPSPSSHPDPPSPGRGLGSAP
jgi:crotonobetaine/carnitine-CoA ligase